MEKFSCHSWQQEHQGTKDHKFSVKFCSTLVDTFSPPKKSVSRSSLVWERLVSMYSTSVCQFRWKQLLWGPACVTMPDTWLRSGKLLSSFLERKKSRWSRPQLSWQPSCLFFLYTAALFLHFKRGARGRQEGKEEWKTSKDLLLFSGAGS